MVESSLPVTIWLSSNATQRIASVWPCNVFIHIPVLISHNRSALSAPPVTSMFPLACRQYTLSLHFSVFVTFQLLVSQIFTVLSQLPVINKFLSWSIWRLHIMLYVVFMYQVISAAWSRKVRRSVPESKAQTLTDLSSLPEMRVFLTVSKNKQRMVLVWPTRTRETFCAALSHTFVESMFSIQPQWSTWTFWSSIKMFMCSTVVGLKTSNDTLILVSTDPETRLLPSNWIAVTAAVCPFNDCIE